MTNIAILGAGNIGKALAKGFLRTSKQEIQLQLVVRREEHRQSLLQEGYAATLDASAAIAAARVVILAVTPGQIAALNSSIAGQIKDHHFVISAVSSVSIATLRNQLGTQAPIVRVMPNIAAAIGQSMTALAWEDRDATAGPEADRLFQRIGKTMIIKENQMMAATVLCACSTAFFLRAIRAAAQGGTQIGFHPEEALPVAAQVALGAAGLVLEEAAHPETEIDRVTTPQGSTIAGLIEMEYNGFSSALIRGMVTSHEKTRGLS
ncbi:MAG: NAD(P)-binding domain-containing protein [Spirochaetes bacterium]|nr:NAD(P)-binding domain-containing protein [Spirochaetota bacterium]MBU0954024.1 NAD(P)-binding domain-containing protein [Spirochaetota bacterium]